jgi:hypothetical protein
VSDCPNLYSRLMNFNMSTFLKSVAAGEVSQALDEFDLIRNKKQLHRNYKLIIDSILKLQIKINILSHVSSRSTSRVIDKIITLADFETIPRYQYLERYDAIFLSCIDIPSVVSNKSTNTHFLILWQ